jgi:hypothetical protein
MSDRATLSVKAVAFGVGIVLGAIYSLRAVGC